MKFTVVFETHDRVDLSYGLLFVPTPFFVRGAQVVLNLNPQQKEYQLGSAARLINQEQIMRALPETIRACAVIVHPIGSGTIKDLETLVKDLRSEGFAVTVCAYNGFEPYDFTVSF